MSAQPVASPDEAPKGRPPGWRGQGLFVQRGALRIRNLRLTLNADQTELLDSSMITELRADTTWAHWLAAAADACEQAQAARDAGVVAGPDEEFNRALEREFRASMLGLTGAAFAIDAFYASTVEHAPDARVRARSRAAAMTETLKRAFEIRGAQQQAVRQPLGEIFRFRHQAVHPPASFAEPAGHPVYGLGMEPRLVIFRVENAQTARRFAHGLIWYCLRKPKPRHRALVEGCEAHKDLLCEPEQQSNDP